MVWTKVGVNVGKDWYGCDKQEAPVVRYKYQGVWEAEENIARRMKGKDSALER